MRTKIAAMWDSVPPDVSSTLRSRLDAALDNAAGTVRVFFRADDVAVPGRNLTRLVECFRKHRMPLSFAVVPAWLTRTRWGVLRELAGGQSGLFSWHQHGWRHVNHESAGKKQEFGPARSRAMLFEELMKGRRRLQALMDRDFTPVFTPPWNRCDRRTMELLADLNYPAVSRSQGSYPQPPRGLQDISVNVDLHTIKETTPRTAWERFFQDLEYAVTKGVCGIMIHHRRMNTAAFGFLELLLKEVRRRNRMTSHHLHQMIREKRVS